MKCQENKHLIYSYLDGELSANRERVLYAHLVECSECQLEMDRARKLHSLLDKSIEYVQPPQDFAKGVMDRLAAKEAQEKAVSQDAEAFETKRKAVPVYKKPWFAVAAGIVFTIMAISSFNQVAQITVDPDANDGFFIAIQPKNVDRLIEENRSSALENPNEKAGNEKDIVSTAVTDETQSTEPGEDSATPAGAEEATEDKEQGEIVIAQAPSQTSTPFITNEPITALQNATSSLTLTTLMDQVSSATWSSTGSTILLLEEDGGSYQLSQSQPNGTGKIALESFDSTGVLSPDKSAVLYNKIVDSTNTIWLETEGKTINLTPADKNKGMYWAYNPVWSNNNEAAFLTDRFGETEIMVVDMEGNLRRVTTSGGKKQSPVWSPDGTQMAYYSTWESNDAQMGEIIIVSADGKNLRKVTPAVKSDNMVASWSPDGKFLIVNVKGENQGIWLTGTDDSKWERQLTARGGGDVIAWSPDGQKIVFNDSQGVFYVLAWMSMTSKIELMQVNPLGNKLNQTSVEWSANSNSLLLLQSFSGDSKKVWIANLPKATSAH